MKRAFDIVFSLFLLVIFGLVILIIALLVKIKVGSPVFFQQIRPGKNENLFALKKFRTMTEAKNKEGILLADADRLTSFGKFLRKTSLDELPQLFNVLKGEMSVVGPRPERPEFVAELERRIPYYRQRHCVKPGITGWAQINHKYGDTLEDTIMKLEYDLYYIKNLAPALDAYIMFHTAKVMLLSRGAQ